MVDGTSGVPPLDEAALKRLTKALDHEGVVAAMLMSSQARIRCRMWISRSGMSPSSTQRPPYGFRRDSLPMLAMPLAPRRSIWSYSITRLR